MNTTYYPNRVVVSFQTNDSNVNAIHSIIAKYNAQNGLLTNRFGGSLSNDRSHYIKKGPTVGGAVTFHSHSCDIAAASQELIDFLESAGLRNEKYAEKVVTVRPDGTPYKRPQHIIVAL